MKFPEPPSGTFPPPRGADDDVHRALVSLVEELQAVDWYGQRLLECGDEALHEVLRHNQHEEIEHAMMLIEWLRCRHPAFALQAKTYLFAGPSPGGRSPGGVGASDGSLGLGDLRGSP